MGNCGKQKRRPAGSAEGDAFKNIRNPCIALKSGACAAGGIGDAAGFHATRRLRKVLNPLFSAKMR